MKKATPLPFGRAEGKPLSLSCCPASLLHSRSIKCFGLLLSAVTISLHYLPRCLRSTVTCGKIPIAATWS